MQAIELTEAKPSYPAQTAYRTIRKQIAALGAGTGVVAVTSCAPNEGKSTVAYHLACAFAECGAQTLLIDADLHNSTLREIRKSGTVKWGLAHVLVGQRAFGDALCRTDVKNLDIVFAGPPMKHTQEALDDDCFREIIQNARSAYQCVVVDTPPIGVVVDAAVVARLCDGVALVVEAGNVSGRFVRRVKKQLEKAGCRVLGAVLTKAAP
ncbi:MAG: CpsD/CapB family tyrosine-protein kinase [Lachnospiraceae bacterium]|jgi:capsular exopolysaccharide synthesis family protein|nr:CpsD/CapB family tyrosine-protein kinase [Lachnospiraceae bacterium]